MTFPQILSTCAVSLALAAPAFADDHAHAGHEAAVRAAVMDYFEGGSDGDRARIDRAFQTDVGEMFIRRTGEDGRDYVEAMNLGVFAERIARPSPVERSGEIVEIRIVDDAMAFAHFSFTTPDRQFDDFFVLYLINNEWKIVTKAFTVEALEE